jgi:hypothetical protein
MGEWRYSSTGLDLGTRWGTVVSFTPRPLYPRGKAPGTDWIRGLYRESNPGSLTFLFTSMHSAFGSLPFSDRNLATYSQSRQSLSSDRKLKIIPLWLDTLALGRGPPYLVACQPISRHSGLSSSLGTDNLCRVATEH